MLQQAPELRQFGGYFVLPLGENLFRVSDGLGSMRFPVVNGAALLGFFADICELGENGAVRKWTGVDQDAERTARESLIKGRVVYVPPHETQVVGMSVEELGL